MTEIQIPEKVYTSEGSPPLHVQFNCREDVFTVEQAGIRNLHFLESCSFVPVDAGREIRTLIIERAKRSYIRAKRRELKNVET